MTPRLLVTGSSGQLGGLILEAAQARGWQTAGLDRIHGPRTRYAVDIRDRDRYQQALNDLAPHIVVHAAAQVRVAESVDKPSKYRSHNVHGTHQVLRAAHRCGATRFVFISSAAVYGKPSQIPIPETHPKNPLSPYGHSKLEGETLVRSGPLDHTIVRPFNLYSHRMRPNDPYSGVLAVFAQALSKHDPVIVHGDGKQTRDFTSAAEAAGAILDLCQDESARGATLNLGTGHGTSILELARRLAGAQPTTLHIEHSAKRAGDIRHSVADATRAASHGVHLTPLSSVDDDTLRHLVKSLGTS